MGTEKKAIFYAEARAAFLSIHTNVDDGLCISFQFPSRRRITSKDNSARESDESF